MTRDFEAYAREQYLGAMCQSDTAPEMLLAGARFTETRKVAGQEHCLRDLLGTDVPASIEKELDAACVGAMVATTEDRLSTARFLAVALTSRPPRNTAAMYEKALTRLAPEAHEALLTELVRPEYDAPRLRILAQTLQQLTKVPPPQPLGKWTKSDLAHRVEVVEAWRQRIGGHSSIPPRN